MKKYLPVMLVFAGAAAFVFGLLQLFQLRFETGDVYAEYSSLRADPLGTMAFYESLERMPDLSVQRDYSTANKLPDGRDTAYLHLAASVSDWRQLDTDTFREIDQFLARGGRLVITFFPMSATSFAARHLFPKTNSTPEKVESPTDGKKPEDKKPEDKIPESADPKKKKPKSPLAKELEHNFVSLEKRWGVNVIVGDLEKGADDVYEPVRVENRTDLPLPETLDWHSGITFTTTDKAWRTIYAHNKDAVVMERHFGPGTVVIASDSYFLSNEAIQKDRHAEFLAWLIGPSRHIVFDEAHLGVTEGSGVAILMRKYRLHWLAGGLLLLAALFIWKNSASLAPAHRDESQTDFIAGKDAAAGFVNLLRRSIAPRDVLSVCFAEWKKSAAGGRKYSAARLQQAEAVFAAENALPPNQRDSVAAYRQISSILENRNPEAETKP